MTLLRLMPRASILTGMTFTSLAVYSNPAHAEPEFCIIASNGKTLCRTTRGIERMCITTDGTNNIYGKFKSFKPAGQEAQSENSTPTLIAGYRKESDGVTFLLRSCKRSSSDIKCNLVGRDLESVGYPLWVPAAMRGKHEALPLQVIGGFKV